MHDTRAETSPRSEGEFTHLPLEPPGHAASPTGDDPIPRVRELGQHGVMEGQPVPRGESRRRAAVCGE
jgi:hypothetical protein